jgi:hypothetical protein
VDDLTKTVIDYFEARGLIKPTAEEGLQWTTTELAEATFHLLSKTGKPWIRNNPDKATVFNKVEFGTECGDIAMMAIMAAVAEGVDPIALLRDKMKRKLREHEQEEA